MTPVFFHVHAQEVQDCSVLRSLQTERTRSPTSEGTQVTQSARRHISQTDLAIIELTERKDDRVVDPEVLI